MLSLAHHPFLETIMTITLAQYCEFYSNWHGADGGRITVLHGEKRNDGQRMGQAFCNKFFKADESFPVLFHERDWHAANRMIFNQFVEHVPNHVSLDK